MKKTPLVSVVITCYNHEKYIEKCIKSIFLQTYKNIQLVVINDGSTDNSGEIIVKLLSSSPFQDTQYIYQENAGVCVARNNTLSLVSGEFILFVDSDNFLDSNYIEILLDEGQKNQADIIYTDLYNAETNEVYLKSQNFDLKSYFEGNYIDSCSLIRKSSLGNISYDLNLNRKKLEDYDLFLNMIINNHATPYYSKLAKLNYRVLPQSLSRKTSEKFYYEVYIYILSKYLDKCESEVLDALKGSILNLEDRLTDLINHLGDVTQHVHNVEEHNIQVTELLKNSQNNVHNLENHLKDLENHLENLENQLIDKDVMIGSLQEQHQIFLNSKDYILGKKLLRPLRAGKKMIKDPQIVKSYAKRGVNKLIRIKNSTPKLKTQFLQLKQNVARKQNNYTSPKRILIYVIYENEKSIQEYKVIFLKALAELCDKVVIIVNGSLPQNDLDRLNQIGQVEERENSGYDTAAFRYGILKLGKKIINQYDELLLVNDTNVGPLFDLNTTFKTMAEKKLDFWGIAYGERQPDFTGYNRYHYIPVHLQSFFLVIEKAMISNDKFYKYWKDLTDTNSREKAIGKHETVFTKYFSDLGFKHGALAEDSSDSAMYIHPLKMIQSGVPLVKLTAFSNYNDDKFSWQGLNRKTEVPDLIEYIEKNTTYPMSIINKIMDGAYNKKFKEHILIIDGVENIIPQCTRYRVLNKAEQLRNAGFDVWTINLSDFQMGYAEHASHIIIYRSPSSEKLMNLIHLAKKYNKPILYDIDDLVIDTKFTDMLKYTQELSPNEKANYDVGVQSYGTMMGLCDGIISSTGMMKKELLNYNSFVLLNRNLASQELCELSANAIENKKESQNKVKIGYFSGTITHNENFELIKSDILKILKNYPETELHLVGHLSIPEELKSFHSQLVLHKFVEWHKLPSLIADVDINLAPLVGNLFNEAKSEIKWLEAALVKVPTLASNMGSFKEIINDYKTGILVNDDEWYDRLEEVILSKNLRTQIGEKALEYTMNQCTTKKDDDELVRYLSGK